MRRTTNSKRYVIAPLAFFYDKISDPQLAKTIIDTAEHWDKITDILYFRDSHPLATYLLIKGCDTVKLAHFRGWEKWR